MCRNIAVYLQEEEAKNINNSCQTDTSLSNILLSLIIFQQLTLRDFCFEKEKAKTMASLPDSNDSYGITTNG